MRSLMVGIAMLTASTAALAGGAEGVWKTEADDKGSYLEVTIAPCDSDSTKICGKISNAFTKQGADPKYANLGKLMVEAMESSDAENYSGGTIWDPVHDKTFKSKMKLKGDDLDVSGCISIVCIGQDWKRVK